MIITCINWFKTEDKKPTKSGEYFVVTDKGNVTTMHYSSYTQKFNSYDIDDRYAVNCTFWAEIPEKIINIANSQYYKTH